jgi:hypothetical protein
MNSDKSLLIKNSLDNIIRTIRNTTNELFLKNDKIELSHHILLEYYNLIANNITDQNIIIYILHLISREINKSVSIIEKKLLLSLVPEFFIPFFANDITLTYPYLSRLLTTIQSNILSEIPPIYIGEIFKKIIFYLFNDEEGQNRIPVNKDLFEICQGFCFYNMKLNDNNSQLVGIICLNILLTEIDYSFLNKNNFALYIWDKITLILDSPKFLPKKYLLKYIYDFISKFKIPFRPLINMAIYTILEFLDNPDANIRKASLNILGLLISFYPEEIGPIKHSIIKLLTILHSDKDDNIRNKSIYIYNKIRKQYYQSHSINPVRRRKYNLFFYDSGYDHWFNKDEIRSNANTNTNRNSNTNNLFQKRLLSRNTSYGNLNLCCENTLKKTINTEPRGSKSDIGEISKFLVKNKNHNENKRYEDININISKVSNINDNESIGFRELLNMVKMRSDNKCKINGFHNLRDEIKKNNNGILKIRKIKNEKAVKPYY